MTRRLLVLGAGTAGTMIVNKLRRKLPRERAPPLCRRSGKHLGQAPEGGNLRIRTRGRMVRGVGRRLEKRISEKIVLHTCHMARGRLKGT